MELDWKNSLDDLDGGDDGEIWPRRIILGPREIWVISPTGIVHLRVRIV